MVHDAWSSSMQRDGHGGNLVSPCSIVDIAKAKDVPHVSRDAFGNFGLVIAIFDGPVGGVPRFQ